MTLPSATLDERCCEVPLVEQLRSIPKDYRTVRAIQWSDDGRETGHQYIPVGVMMHRAADEIDRLRAGWIEADKIALEARIKDASAVSEIASRRYPQFVAALREPSNSGSTCKGLVLEAADRIEGLERELGLERESHDITKRMLESAVESTPSATRLRLPQHVKDFIDDRSDIRDGQDGPLPNDWMTLQQIGGRAMTSGAGDKHERFLEVPASLLTECRRLMLFAEYTQEAYARRRDATNAANEIIRYLEARPSAPCSAQRIVRMAHEIKPSQHWIVEFEDRTDMAFGSFSELGAFIMQRERGAVSSTRPSIEDAGRWLTAYLDLGGKKVGSERWAGLCESAAEYLLKTYAVSATPCRLSGIYVASRVKQAEVWKAYRAKGWKINSTWIDEAGEGETPDFGDLWTRIRDEIARSHCLVFYAAGVEDFPFKGALVEVGMALAMGKPVIVALENVMLDGRTLRPVGSWLLDRKVIRCDTLEEAMDVARSADMICRPDGGKQS